MPAVVIFCAGLGTRLKPLTNNLPKCLVEVDGVPLLERLLDQVSLCSPDQVFINTFHLAHQIRSFVDRVAEKYLFEIIVTVEPELLGTANTLRQLLMEGQISASKILFMHGDNYHNVYLEDFIANARAYEHKLSVVSFKTLNPEECGIFQVGSGEDIVAIHHKKNNINLFDANGAIYFCSKHLLQYLVDEFPRAVDFSSDILPFIPDQLRLYFHRGIFIDIGTPRNLAEASKLAFDKS